MACLCYSCKRWIWNNFIVIFFMNYYYYIFNINIILSAIIQIKFNSNGIIKKNTILILFYHFFYDFVYLIASDQKYCFFFVS